MAVAVLSADAMEIIQHFDLFAAGNSRDFIDVMSIADV